VLILILVDIMNGIEVFLKIAIMGLGFLLFIIMIMAYSRVKNTKLLFATVAFFLFFIKGLLLTLGLVSVYFFKTFPTTIEISLIDFLILILLYFGIAKK
jgi:hypothetical protein